MLSKNSLLYNANPEPLDDYEFKWEESRILIGQKRPWKPARKTKDSISSLDVFFTWNATLFSQYAEVSDMF